MPTYVLYDSDYPPEGVDDHEKLVQRLFATDDAMVWAEEFCRLYGTEEIDEGLMVGWFANAMATAVQKAVERARDYVGDEHG